MVRAGKVAKGFTPRTVEEQREGDKGSEHELAFIPKLKEWWSAFVIQRAWRRKRAHRAPLQWEDSGASSESKLDFDSGCGENSVNCKSELINYAKKNQIVRLFKNLTTRILEARPQDAKAYLLSLLEAWKARRAQKEVIDKFRSENDALGVEGCERGQGTLQLQPSDEPSSQSIVDPLSSPLGIFSQKDLQVLFEYCTRTNGAGAANELQKLAYNNSSKSSLAYEVLEVASNMCSNGLPSLYNFSIATSKPIEECFSLASL